MESPHETFNKLISEEILAVLQYKLMAHWCMFNRYQKLAYLIDNIRKEEEEHIEELTEKAFQLNLFSDIKYFISTDEVANDGDIITADLTPEIIIEKFNSLEQSAINSYIHAINDSEIAKEDPSVAELFKHILDEEKQHDAIVEAELKKLSTLGSNDWLTTLVESKKPDLRFKPATAMKMNRMQAMYKAFRARASDKDFKIL